MTDDWNTAAQELVERDAREAMRDCPTCGHVMGRLTDEHGVTDLCVRCNREHVRWVRT